jgi:hypothetical protein
MIFISSNGAHYKRWIEFGEAANELRIKLQKDGMPLMNIHLADMITVRHLTPQLISHFQIDRSEIDLTFAIEINNSDPVLIVALTKESKKMWMDELFIAISSYGDDKDEVKEEIKEEVVESPRTPVVETPQVTVPTPVEATPTVEQTPTVVTTTKPVVTATPTEPVVTTPTKAKTTKPKTKKRDILAELGITNIESKDYTKARIIDLSLVRNGTTPILMRITEYNRGDIRVEQVELCSNSIDSRFVFILDCGKTIYQWNGNKSNRLVRAKGMEISSTIKYKERGGTAKVVIIDNESPESREEFMKLVGGYDPQMENRSVQLTIPKCAFYRIGKESYGHYSRMEYC